MRHIACTPGRWLVMAAVLVMLLAFPAMAWPNVLGNTDSTQTDQEDFLLLGQDIRAGVRWSDGNRQPLLPAVLSPLASTDWSYFSSAKIMNLGLAVLLLALLLWLDARLFGIEVALLSVVLTVLNPDFRDTSARVVAEPLLSVFFLLTFYFWYRSMTQPGLTRRDRVWALVLAGASAGLGYLTKGTSQLLVIGVVCWWAMSGRWKDHALPVVGFIVAYLAVIAPLLVYNLHAWGNPLYNFNSTHAMWLDSWDDVWLPSVSVTTFQSYLVSHTPREMLDRLVTGVFSLIDKRGDVFLPSGSLVILAAGVVTGVTARCLVRRDHSPREQSDGSRLQIAPRKALSWHALSLPASVLVPWLLFFAWYFPISGSPRHHIPVLPLVNTVVAVAAWRLLAAVGRHWIGYLRIALCIVIVAGCCYGVVDSLAGLRQSGATWDVYLSDRQANAELDQLLWGLQDSRPGPVVVVNGPNRLIPLWRARATTLAIHAIPAECQSLGHLASVIERTAADYLIVDALVVQRRACLQKVFRLRDEDSFESVGEVPGMHLMADYSVGRQRIMIFERER